MAEMKKRTDDEKQRDMAFFVSDSLWSEGRLPQMIEMKRQLKDKTQSLQSDFNQAFCTQFEWVVCVATLNWV